MHQAPLLADPAYPAPADEGKGDEPLALAFPAKDADEDEITVAEAIPNDAEVKGIPTAQVYCPDEAEPVSDYGDDEEESTVRVDMEELCPVADVDGVRRRALALRDAIFTNAPTLALREDEGDLTDVEAVILRDEDASWTLLHHAAFLGRRALVEELLAFSRRRLQALGGPGATRAYCDATDERHRRALDLALEAGHHACVVILREDTSPADAKAEAKSGPSSSRQDSLRDASDVDADADAKCK